MGIRDNYCDTCAFGKYELEEDNFTSFNNYRVQFNLTVILIKNIEFIRKLQKSLIICNSMIYGHIKIFLCKRLYRKLVNSSQNWR